jgi:hypothetical protein
MGEPLAALVEDDHPGEGREPLEQVLVDRELPVELGVRQAPRNEDEIAGPIAEHPVGDVNVSARGVVDLAGHGPRLMIPRGGGVG